MQARATAIQKTLYSGQWLPSTLWPKSGCKVWRPLQGLHHQSKWVLSEGLFPTQAHSLLTWRQQSRKYFCPTFKALSPFSSSLPSPLPPFLPFFHILGKHFTTHSQPKLSIFWESKTNWKLTQSQEHSRECSLTRSIGIGCLLPPQPLPYSQCMCHILSSLACVCTIYSTLLQSGGGVAITMHHSIYLIMLFQHENNY
jgi:hypothetical protein